MIQDDNFLNIPKCKRSFDQSKELDDSLKLRETVSDFYKQILYLADQIISLKEQRTDLIHDRELLTDKNMQIDIEFVNLNEHFNKLKDERDTLSEHVNELEATTSQLTGWNGSLEQQCAILKASIIQQKDLHHVEQQTHQEETLTLTNKLINLCNELDHCEWELYQMRLSLRESQEIAGRLYQENAILKSKLYQVHTKMGGGTINSINNAGDGALNNDSPITWRGNDIKSPESLRMNNIELKENDTIASVLKVLKSKLAP